MAAPSDRFDAARLRRTYDDFARWYAFDSALVEYGYRARPLRRWLAGRARGRVLDVACGTGAFLRHLRGATDVVAVDLSPGMLARARNRAAGLDLPVGTAVMDAEHLGLPDDSVDTVVSSLSTCTFPDPLAALREMARVLRPGGEILLLEHGRSRVPWLARWQDQNAAAHYQRVGCRWNQDPGRLAREAGLDVLESRTAFFGIVTGLRSVPRASTSRRG